MQPVAFLTTVIALLLVLSAWIGIMLGTAWALATVANLFLVTKITALQMFAIIIVACLFALWLRRRNR